MKVASCLAISSLPLFSQGIEDYSIPQDFATSPKERRTAPVVVPAHFGVGGGLTASSLRSSMKNLTGGERGKGFFAEVRYPSAPQGLPEGLFARYRLAYDDWGDQRMMELQNRNETAHVRRWAATVGGGIYGSRNHLLGWYITMEIGIAHWDIKSTYPTLENLNFRDFAGNLLMGFEAFRFFFEFGTGNTGARKRIRSRVPEFQNSDPNAPLGHEGYFKQLEEDYSTVFFLGYRF